MFFISDETILMVTKELNNKTTTTYNVRAVQCLPCFLYTKCNFSRISLTCVLPARTSEQGNVIGLVSVYSTGKKFGITTIQ